MKSIPVVQQVYQAILADMTLNFNVLLHALNQKSILLGTGPSSTDTSELSEDNAEAALIFDCSALCQIGNVKGNLIGVSHRRVLGMFYSMLLSRCTHFHHRCSSYWRNIFNWRTTN